MLHSLRQMWFPLLVVGSFCLLAGELASGAARGEFAFFMPIVPQRPIAVVAAGETSTVAPGNTRRALQHWMDDGVEWVAVDVRRTRDGEHVLFSSDELAGLSDGTGRVSERSLAELQKLDVGSWFAPRYARTRILTLDEALKLVAGRMNLLLRCHDVEPERLVRQIQRARLQSQVALDIPADEAARLRSLTGDSLALVAQCDSAPIAGWDMPTDVEAWLERRRPRIVQLEASDATAELIAQLHARGIQAMVQLAPADDHPEIWDSMQRVGVDLLMTHVPEEMITHILSKQFGDRRAVEIAIHRGASRYAPENTLPALAKAFRLQADYVEIDVRTSADGEHFILHDGNLNRTTDATGPLAERTAAEIEQLDAGSWFGVPFAKTPVPRLEAFLAMVPPAGQVYFDAKDIAPAALATALERHDLVERTVVYQSAEYLARLKQIDPRIRVMPSADSIERVSQLADNLQPYAVDAPWKTVNREFVEHCHALGIRVFSDANPLVSVAGYQNMIQSGVDLIQTDHPLRLWRAIELLHVESNDRSASAH